MKHITCIILILLLGVSAFSAAEPKPIDASKIEKREDGLYYLKGGKKLFTGSTIKHHKNGSKKEMETYKDGKYHGIHRGWYANGKKEYEASWDGGAQQGLTNEWSDSGNRIRVAAFVKGKKDLAKTIELMDTLIKSNEKKLGLKHLDLAKCYAIQGLNFNAIGKHEKALQLQYKSLEIRKQKLGPLHEILGPLLTNIGHDHMALREHEKALASYQNALKIYIKAKGPENPGTASVYVNIGGAYQESGKYKSALENFKKALAIRIKHHGPSHELLVHDYHLIGVSLSYLDKLDASLNNFHKALEIGVKHHGPDHPSIVLSYEYIASIHANKREYGKVLEAYGKALAIKEKHLGAEHDETLRLRDEIASLHGGIGQPQKALEIYREIVNLLIKSKNADHPDVLEKYREIAMCLHGMGKYQESLKRNEQTLKILVAKYGKNDPRVGYLYNNIGSNYWSMEKPAMAMEYYKKAKDNYIKNNDKDSESVVAVLNNIATAHSDLGQHEDAVTALENALKIINKIKGKDSVDEAFILNNMAQDLGEIGDLQKELELLNESLRIRLRLFGEMHPDVANSYANLGSCYMSLDNYEYAEKSYLKSLAIRKKVLGAYHPRLALAHQHLSRFYLRYYKEALAEHHVKLANVINVKAFGEKHPAVARSYYDVGEFYGRIGMIEKAVENHKKAVETALRIYGENSVETASYYNSLARSYLPWIRSGKVGDSESLKFYNKALNILIEKHGKKHPSVASVYVGISNVYYYRGEYTKMLNLCRALEKADFGDGNMTSAQYNNMGFALQSQGSYTESIKYFEKAVESTRDALGGQHYRYAECISNLGFAYMDGGFRKEALELATQAQGIRRKRLEYILSFASEGERLEYLGSQYYLMLQLLGSLGEAKPLAEVVLRTKGIVLASILEDQFAVSNSSDPKIRSLLDKLKIASRKFNKLQGKRFSSETEGYQAMHKERVSKARDEVGQLQKQMAKSIYGFGQSRASMAIETGNVQEKLPQDAALVEFIQYSQRTKAKGLLGVILRESPEGIEIKELQEGMPAVQIGMMEGDIIHSVDAKKSSSLERFLKNMSHYDPGEEVSMTVLRGSKKIQFSVKLAPPAQGSMWLPSYGAIILSKEGEPKWVPLGLAEDVDLLLAEYSPMKPADDEAYEKVLRGLYDKLMAPIVKELPKDTKTLILSPDGPLNFLSFATLLTEEDTFLCEEYTLKYVSSGRDMMRQFQPAQGSLAVYANPAYTEKPIRLANANGNGINLRSTDRDELRGSLQFKALPGTQKEADYLKNKAENWKLKADVYVGKAATEGAISRVKSPRILHLATHGFFIPEAKEGRKQSPMVRSGLAFAGAQKTLDAWAKGETPPTYNDGILTAAEVSVLDLKGTWLVTLSACETGRGEARSGEGVLGLRRAFIQAGTQNLLMTLWPVDDKQTIPFMKDFYERAMAGGDAPESLAKVQTERLVKLRDVLGTRLAVQFAGPFIMSFQGGVK